MCDGFGHHIPGWISPVLTFATVGFFFIKSLLDLRGKTGGKPA
jgi:hypothetical protein